MTTQLIILEETNEHFNGIIFLPDGSRIDVFANRVSGKASAGYMSVQDLPKETKEREGRITS